MMVATRKFEGCIAWDGRWLLVLEALVGNTLALSADGMKEHLFKITKWFLSRLWCLPLPLSTSFPSKTA